jgi:hypothetical protein
MIDQYGGWHADYPGQTPFQDPMYMRAMGQLQHQQTVQQQPQQPTQPRDIRTVEVVPADSEKQALEFPVGAGETKLIIHRGDNFVVVKTVSVTGEVTTAIFDRRPPAPPPETINPADYVRRDEVAALVAEIIRDNSRRKTTAEKKEAE